MADKGGGSLCFEDQQLISFSSLQCEGNNENIFLRKINGETLAIKKLAPTCDGVGQQEDQWEKLIKLRDNHIVRYRQCVVHQDVRYLVMESCQGSMLNYCRKNLDDSVASAVKGIDIMWQVTCGVDYLHRNKISHGDLNLENVLFWRRDLKSKRVVVKITGYGYIKDFQPRDNVKSRLGILYYAAATKEEVFPNGPITLESLTEIDEKHRALALDLIRVPTKADFSDLEVTGLLRHPFFIRCSEESRSRLFTELQMDAELFRVCNQDTLQAWEGCLDKSKFPEEEFEELKYTMLADNDEITSLLIEAFKSTPQLFSAYIWHITTSFKISKDNKNQSVEILEILGKGNYGKVFKCNYTDESGKTYLAACKKCSPNPDAGDVFDREVETLNQLNHLFVVKYLDLVENQSKKYIVMELCEGSLKDYVEGKLERIPIDSLDDKILISQVALGVAYIHSKDIIHKDLKLASILLWCQTSNSRLVLAKIADFGLAKKLKSGQTEFSYTAHPGTENYMAPELLNAQGSAYPASFASDVYAFGIIIARIVKKGDHPFSSGDVWRKVSMVHGLVPQNIQDLSWDLQDLIIKLTDRDPGKRPMMALVLRHPYFVLTNERTKKYFLDRLWVNIILCDDGIELFADKILSAQSLDEWYHGLSGEKQFTTEDIERMAKTFQFFCDLKPDILPDMVYPEKEYSRTIKEAIAIDYDADVGFQVDKLKRRSVLTRNRLGKLILQSPILLVSYFWAHLPFILSLNKPLASSVTGREDDQQNTTSTASRPQCLSGEMDPEVQWNSKIISEIEWSSLFCEEEEFVNELWTIKYGGQYNKSPETEREVIELVANCKITEEVWSAILNQFESQLELLLLKIVKSSACNAPKLTRMLLKRNGSLLELQVRVSTRSTPYDAFDGLYPANEKMRILVNELNKAKETMRILLEADVNATVDSVKLGYLAIQYAATKESSSAPKIIEVLLEHGASPSSNGYTPFLVAARNEGHYALEMMKQLLDYTDSSNANELTLFLCCALINYGECGVALVELLLKNIKTEAIQIYEELLCLVLVDEVYGLKKLKLIFEKGVKPNPAGKDKITILHYAVMEQTTQTLAIIETLLEYGSDLNASDEYGNTPIHYAAINQGEHAYETMKFLLSKGGDVKIKRKDGLAPVHLALLNRGICGEKMRKLVGVDQESFNVPIDNTGITLLHFFVNVRPAKVDVVQLILDHGGNPNTEDKSGTSPVHSALQNHSQIGLTILQLLLQKGGNPNSFMGNKELRQQPVHHVALFLNENADEQMAILLENNGNANASNKYGLTPMHVAALNPGIHAPKLVKILLNHGGNPNAGDTAGHTPVHYVVREKRSSLEVLKLLVENGGNIFQLDNRRMSPFIYAIQRGSEKYCLPEVKNYLVERFLKNVFKVLVERKG
uniref:Ankyrin n=1 Tax=Daphnia magna TaxID=35525 RepID=A0A0P4ZNA8_9CRUS